jgi:hypothetical protein
LSAMSTVDSGGASGDSAKGSGRTPGAASATTNDGTATEQSTATEENVSPAGGTFGSSGISVARE